MEGPSRPEFGDCACCEEQPATAKVTITNNEGYVQGEAALCDGCLGAVWEVM